jgi:DNA replicative helicase MCM subunit Mcm2 (Cdc46/Mcm family)
MTDEPTPDDRETLTELIDDHDLPWEVNEWWYESGKYEEPTLTLDVTWSSDTDGEFDADMVGTGTSAQQRERIQNVKDLVAEIEARNEEGAAIADVARVGVSECGIDAATLHNEIEKLRTKGEVYEPQQGHLRTT